MGAGWRDHGLVVTKPTGEPVNPETFSRAFKQLAAEAKLPPIRLHDVRHSYATAALNVAGVGLKVLSQRLGHADVGVTMKVYQHVLPHQDEETAGLVASLIDGR